MPLPPESCFLWPFAACPQPRGKPFTDDCGMGFVCNASISISFKVYSLECARVQGSPFDLFPEVTCIRGTVSSQVTNLGFCNHKRLTLIIQKRIILQMNDFMLFCSPKEDTIFSQTPLSTDYLTPVFFCVLPESDFFVPSVNDTSMYLMATCQLQSACNCESGQ